MPGSKVSPIDVDNIPIDEGPFSLKWEAEQSGQSLLDLKLPSIRAESDPHVVVYRVLRSAKILSTAEIMSLEAIPSHKAVEKAVHDFQQAKQHPGKPWGVTIPGIGFMKEDSLLLLCKISKTCDHAENTRQFLRWIDTAVSRVDPAFGVWLRNTFLQEPGIIGYKFPVTGIAAPSIFRLVGESYIDDDIVGKMLELFEAHYGAKGRYAFIPPLTMEIWRRDDTSDFYNTVPGPPIDNPSLESVFAVVAMSEHWGVLKVDLKEHTISFGDSLGYPIPRDAVDVVQRWLNWSHPDHQKWDGPVGVFPVPRQPPGSGSCAVNAINAIERNISTSTKFEIWTHARSEYHRVRMATLATGYLSLESASYEETTTLRVTRQRANLSISAKANVTNFAHSCNELATIKPSQEPTREPSKEPTQDLSQEPTQEPTHEPAKRPTKKPTKKPTKPAKRPAENLAERPFEKSTDNQSTGIKNGMSLQGKQASTCSSQRGRVDLLLKVHQAHLFCGSCGHKGMIKSQDKGGGETIVTSLLLLLEHCSREVLKLNFLCGIGKRRYRCLKQTDKKYCHKNFSLEEMERWLNDLDLLVQSGEMPGEGEIYQAIAGAETSHKILKRAALEALNAKRLNKRHRGGSEDNNVLDLAGTGSNNLAYEVMSHDNGCQIIDQEQDHKPVRFRSNFATVRALTAVCASC